jgi:threonine dehydratase
VDKQRLPWPDVAKGACIVLVVLWHVTRKDYLALPWDVELPVTGAWGTFSEVLLPVRMPLFFCVSGLFAARLVDRPWRTVLSGRVLPLLGLFVLWTLLHTLVLQLTPGFDTAIASSPGELAAGLSITPGNLWYLLALPSYVVVARATRRVPHLALVAALALSVVAFAGWVPTPGNRAGLLTNLVFFLLGVRVPGLRPTVSRLLLPSTRGRAAAAVVGFAVGAAAWQVAGADAWPGVRPALGVLGVAAGAGLAAVAGGSRAGRGLAVLGRRTLPVYVLHLPLVALVHVASAQVVVPGGPVARSVPLAAAYPLVTTALVVGASLLLHRALVAAGAAILFEARPVTLRSVRAHVRRPRSAPGRAATASAGSPRRGSSPSTR